MSTKLKLIVNNPELLPDAFLDKVIEYYNTHYYSKETLADRTQWNDADRNRIARWFGNGFCNT